MKTLIMMNDEIHVMPVRKRRFYGKYEEVFFCGGGKRRKIKERKAWTVSVFYVFYGQGCVMQEHDKRWMDVWGSINKKSGGLGFSPMLSH